MQIENPEWRTLMDEKQDITRGIGDATLLTPGPDRDEVVAALKKRDVEVDRLLQATERYIEVNHF